MAAELIFDSRRLAANLEWLRDKLPVSGLYYAVKACGEPQVLESIASCGAGFEIASAGELQRAQETGITFARIHCGLPAKGDALTAELWESGCNSFVFDCPEELAALRRHAPESRKLLRIAIDDIDPESAPWGFPEDAATDFLAATGKDDHDIAGVTFHLARNYRLNVMSAVLDRIARVLKSFAGGAGKVLNIGGGYRADLPPHLARKYDLNAFYDQLATRLRDLQHRYGLGVEAEPGRGIVESAGELRVPVMRVRHDSAGKAEVILELNIGQRPGSHPRAVYALNKGDRELLYVAGAEFLPASEYLFMTDFVDGTCEHSVFYRLPLRRPPRAGEWLALAGMGAYTGCLSSVFHVRPAPQISVV